MVVAREMEQPVEEEALDLARGRFPAPARLARRVRDGDDDVAEEAGGLRGKGQDVGRGVLPPVAPVERSHPPVAAEEDGDFDPGSWILDSGSGDEAGRAGEQGANTALRRRALDSRGNRDDHR